LECEEEETEANIAAVEEHSLVPDVKLYEANVGFDPAGWDNDDNGTLCIEGESQWPLQDPTDDSDLVWTVVKRDNEAKSTKRCAKPKSEPLKKRGRPRQKRVHSESSEEDKSFDGDAENGLFTEEDEVDEDWSSTKAASERRTYTKHTQALEGPPAVAVEDFFIDLSSYITFDPSDSHRSNMEEECDSEEKGTCIEKVSDESQKDKELIENRFEEGDKSAKQPRSDNHKIYGCMFCPFEHRKGLWLKHLRIAHEDKGLIFCEKVRNCFAPFQSEERLQQHIKEAHGPKKRW